jgi:hypothetical protein
MGAYLLESLPRERSECFGHHHRILYAGDYPDRVTAFPAGCDIDLEYTLQALCPGHRGAALGGRWFFNITL